MQGTISFTSRRVPLVATRDSGGGITEDDDDRVEHVTNSVKENAVIVIGRRGCCMCHVAKRLLLGLGVNPAVLEIDENREDEVVRELTRINYGCNQINHGGGMITLPAVFVGGRLFGGLERVMATHISGELVPILKDAGALWL